MSIKNKVNNLSEIYGPMVQKKSKVNKKTLLYLQKRAIELECSKALFVKPREDIFFEERVRVVCANNCYHYGDKLTCPPYIPDFNYEKAIKEYDSGLILIVHRKFDDIKGFETKRTESTNTLHRILLMLEKEAFSRGCFLTTSFIGGSCKLCSECGEVCKHPKLSRIPVEATGMNIVKTLEKLGIDIKFPVEQYNEFVRIGLLLLSK